MPIICIITLIQHQGRICLEQNHEVIKNVLGRLEQSQRSYFLAYLVSTWTQNEN